MIPRLWAAAACFLLGGSYVSAGGGAPDRTAHAEPANDDSAAEASTRRILVSSAQRANIGPQELLPQNVKSLLRISGKMHHGQFVWEERGAPPGEMEIRIDLRSQLISVLRAGHEIGAAVILYGANSHETPTGEFPVLTKLRDHRSRVYDGAPMPFTLRLTDDGVAIHGSDVRDGAATHGCIGVPVEFARHLFEAAQVGDRVIILRSPPAELKRLAELSG